MAEGGYIKLWRRLRRWAVWRAMSWDQRGVLITLLWDANWRDEQIFNTATRKFETVERGSLVISQRELATRCEVGRQVLRTALAMLEANPGDGAFLTREPTQGGTLITIRNYGKYQDSPGDANPGANPEPTQALTQSQPRHLYTKKDQEGKKHSTRAQGALFASPSGTEGEPAPKAKKKPKSKPKNRQPWQQLLDIYHDAFLATHGRSPLIDWAKNDRTKSQAILKGPPARTVEELTPLVRRYVTMDDDWAREQGYPFAGFGSKINKLMVGKRGGRKKAPVVLAERFDD